jgi:hypothetical protein
MIRWSGKTQAHPIEEVSPWRAAWEVFRPILGAALALALIIVVFWLPAVVR